MAAHYLKSITPPDQQPPRESTPGRASIHLDSEPSRELPIKFSPNSIPSEIRDRQQWICWRWEWIEKSGKWDKPPFNPHNPKFRASTTDPTTWSSIRHALAVFQVNPDIDGIGYVLSEGDGLTGVDFDGCISEDGMLDSWVKEWIDLLNGYVEVSPSGTGIHCLVRATLPGPGKNTKLEGRKVEVYDRARYLTTTGAMLVGYENPTDAQEAVGDLYQRLSPPPEVEREMKRLRAPVLTNDQLLDKARTAANGWKFKRLYDNGNWQSLGYESQSNADFGLLCILIYWSGGDREQITELFEESALYRDHREKHRGYLRITVDNAISRYKGSYYDPQHARNTGVRETLKPYFNLVDSAPYWKGGKRPAARKVLAAITLAASEHGKEKPKGVEIGLDMRTLSEVSHVSMKTLLYSSLPLLAQEGHIEWVRQGSRKKASVFLLPSRLRGKTVLDHAYPTVLPPSGLQALGDGERRELLRASQGRSPHAKLPRVGPSKQVLLEHLVGTAGNRLTVREMAERTQRRKDNVRRDMRWLLGQNLVAESTEDSYQLTRDFWERWGEVLDDSGVTRTERRRKARHENERLINAGYEPVWGETGEEWVIEGQVFTKDEALDLVSAGHGDQ